MKTISILLLMLLLSMLLLGCTTGIGGVIETSDTNDEDTPSESSSSINLDLDAEAAIAIANENLAELQANGHFLTYVFDDVHYSETDNTWVVAYRIEPLVPGGGLYYAISKRTGEIVKSWGSE